MSSFSFFAIFIFYAFCDTVFSFYIQTKRFDYDPSPMLMYNQMYSHDHWRPYQYQTVRSYEEEGPINWEDFPNGGTMDKRKVTADQINSLLKNAWLGR